MFACLSHRDGSETVGSSRVFDAVGLISGWRVTQFRGYPCRHARKVLSDVNTPEYLIVSSRGHVVSEGLKPVFGVAQSKVYSKAWFARLIPAFPRKGLRRVIPSSYSVELALYCDECMEGVRTT